MACVVVSTRPSPAVLLWVLPVGLVARFFFAMAVVYGVIGCVFCTERMLLCCGIRKQVSIGRVGVRWARRRLQFVSVHDFVPMGEATASGRKLQYG